MTPVVLLFAAAVLFLILIARRNARLKFRSLRLTSSLSGVRDVRAERTGGDVRAAAGAPFIPPAAGADGRAAYPGPPAVMLVEVECISCGKPTRFPHTFPVSAAAQIVCPHCGARGFEVVVREMAA
ncbi:MAG: hypothetical protein AAFW83_10345 [Pseudomonadota bacterium]